MSTLELVTDAAKEVLRVLGVGYEERAYEEGLAHELRLRQIPYERQRTFEVLYKGYSVGEGRADLIVNPLWAGRGGKELVLELKNVARITEHHQRQAQVYMLSLNIDQGAVLSFSSEVLVSEVEKPQKQRQLVVARPKRTRNKSTAQLLEACAQEVYRYFGQEFIYRQDTRKLFPAGLAVELRLHGCEFSRMTRPVLYKGQEVTSYDFDLSFSDGTAAKVVFYKKAEELKEAVDELKFYKKEFNLKTCYLVAFPDLEDQKIAFSTV